MIARWILAAALAAASAGIAQAAPAPKAPPRQCFLARNIDSWAPQDNETVNLRVSVGDYYQVKLLGDCRDIDWTLSIGIEHRGSDWICDGMDAVLIVPSTIGGPRRCPATSVRKLTPEEVKALPRKARP